MKTMVINKHARSELRVFAVITLLVGCSSETWNPSDLSLGGAAGSPPDSAAGRAGAAGSPAGGQAGADAGSPESSAEAAEAAPPPECSQCVCAFQSGQWCGPKPPEPSSDLACSSTTPHCCVCPGSCQRTGCVYSPVNPIGGHTWMCCTNGV